MPKIPKPGKGRPFPIVEAFGYASDAESRESREAREKRFCRFMGGPCEKYIQYRFGYCSVTYAAADDEGVRRTYAVCDHRLDGDPIQAVLDDHFGRSASKVRLVSEVVLTNPRTSFDYVAITVGAGGEITDVAAIETQSIDIRGGGVGPAWKAWMEGKPGKWREYFTADATAKSRRQDIVAYGVNMANIYKRLGLQVAVKGNYLKGIGVPFYIVMQHRPFEYLRRRIRFTERADSWDITFVTFDYTGARQPDGVLEFKRVSVVRTSLASYVEGLTAASPGDRSYFLERVKSKAGLTN
ncbi:MAG: hypothetical protein JXP73_11770 [Deltaproteobacteria bacterium]|nr:hypothetical protein [Deltaproteobacteria bacterium]